MSQGKDGLIHTIVMAVLLVCACVTLARAETQGVTKDEVTVGAVVDLSGPGAPNGAQAKGGFEQAIEDVNASGGINGRKLRALFEDSGYDPRKAVIVTQKLLEQDKIFAMVGTMGTAIANVTIPLANKRNVATVGPIALSPTLYEPPQRLVFATAPAYTLQASVETTYLYDQLGKRRFCAIYQDDDTGQQVLNGLNEGLKARGAALTDSVSFKRGALDFASQVARLKAANCDAVAIGALVREAAAILIERQKIGWDVAMYAFTSAALDTLIQLGGNATENFYAVMLSQPLREVVATNPNAAGIVDRYIKKHGNSMKPDEGFMIGYWDMAAFIEGAKRAGTDLTTETLVTGLEKLSNYDTGTGLPTITYSPTQRLSSKTMLLMQIKNGKWEKIATLN